jgi:hypothetical protein
MVDFKTSTAEKAILNQKCHQEVRHSERKHATGQIEEMQATKQIKRSEVAVDKPKPIKFYANGIKLDPKGAIETAVRNMAKSEGLD